jgi:hypothetical protein
MQEQNRRCFRAACSRASYLVVASVLMSMGMMMLPAGRGVAAVQADLLRAGRRLVAGSLVQSYGGRSADWLIGLKPTLQSSSANVRNLISPTPAGRIAQTIV